MLHPRDVSGLTGQDSDASPGGPVPANPPAVFGSVIIIITQMT
jgi:hypothetical protein